ncbi:MAG: hypothetical protein O7D91_13410 [Planctomycetota bacterium]|nr:hypothetical protein [Planctomycetota bacterium]
MQLEQYVGRRSRDLIENMQTNKELVNQFLADPVSVLKEFSVPLPETEQRRSELVARLQALPLAEEGFSWECAGCKITLNIAIAAITAVILAALVATAPGEFLIEAGVAVVIAAAFDISVSTVTAILAGLTAGLVVAVEEFIDWMCEKLGFCAA